MIFHNLKLFIAEFSRFKQNIIRYPHFSDIMQRSRTVNIINIRVCNLLRIFWIILQLFRQKFTKMLCTVYMLSRIISTASERDAFPVSLARSIAFLYMGLEKVSNPSRCRFSLLNGSTKTIGAYTSPVLSGHTL